MKNPGAFKAGWLRAELEAATREVDAWPAGMRRQIAETARARGDGISKDEHASKRHEASDKIEQKV